MLKRSLALGLIVVVVSALGAWSVMRSMTAFSGRADGVALTPDPERAMRQTRLARHVRVLSREIGERHLGRPAALSQAASFVEHTWQAQGHLVQRQCFAVEGEEVCNLEVVIPGQDPTLGQLIVGAHYDSAPGTPGADDNASGVAALLELAGVLLRATPRRTIRLVAFVNEEPPWFRGAEMGSRQYVAWLQAQGVPVALMMSLECLGFYDEAPGSQHFPLPGLDHIYPTTGDYIALVGQWSERHLVDQTLGIFRRHAGVASEGSATPRWVQGVDFSDHLAFWDVGLPGVMWTDTAFLRNPHYHRQTDVLETLDLQRMTRVVEGIIATVLALGDADIET